MERILFVFQLDVHLSEALKQFIHTPHLVFSLHVTHEDMRTHQTTRRKARTEDQETFH